MSRVRADKLVNRAGTGAPQLTYGASIPVGYGLTGAGNINITGVATAASFSGNLTGNATGLTGTPNIVVGNIVGSAATFTNLTVNGTQTIINTTTLEIADKTLGISSTSTPSNTTANGAGIIIYGGNDGDKSITWDSSSNDWVVVGGGLSVTDYEGNFILDSYLFNGS